MFLRIRFPFSPTGGSFFSGDAVPFFSVSVGSAELNRLRLRRRRRALSRSRNPRSVLVVFLVDTITFFPSFFLKFTQKFLRKQIQ